MVYKGKTYYFCSKDEKVSFDKSPEQFQKNEKPAKRPRPIITLSDNEA